MIDVTFQLLIFFLCTLRFQTLEGKLAANLPRGIGASAAVAEPLAKVEVRIRVLQEGRRVGEGNPDIPYDAAIHGPRFRFVGREVRYSIGPRNTGDLAVLKAWLVAQADVNRHADGRPRPCAIDARGGVVYEEVVQVLDAAVEAGFREITFVGSYEKG
ncbi:MAG TPA: biopolymer transporter ExbD [Planctomycetota bacterium]|jgi:biopolymer transport protein ExbD|nr:biopolymer transporter ExbD [Planctomycetota bacterium]